MEAKKLDDTKSQAQQSSSSTDTSQDSNQTFLLQSRSINYTTNNMPPPPQFQNSSNTTKPSILLRVEMALNLLNHMFIGFVAIYMSWMCIKLNLKKTALHAWLCTIGFNFLMAEGVMTHYNGNVLLLHYSRKSKTTIHWVLQALGGSLGIAGGIVKIIDKPVHFTSIHGKVGLAALIICALSMLSGLSALYSSNFKRLVQPLQNKTFHNFLGLTGFVLTMVTQFYGYGTGFFTHQTEASFQTMMQVITIFSLVCCCWGPSKSLWIKCKIIKENF